jgi:tetratricopeptide (TPR) repeat protein
LKINFRKVAIYFLIANFAFIVIIAPLLGNAHYRRAYSLYQQHQWVGAAEALAKAERWEPLNAKYKQLRGEALINLDRYDEALKAYQQALRYKRDYAPYHSQLGWLVWLQGDITQATDHFQKAIALDPLEAWRAGLHADLALAYAAQGRIEEAIPLLKQTIELNPQMSRAPYWVISQDENGELRLGLDPIYFVQSYHQSEREREDISIRILDHLGKTNYTHRVIGLHTVIESPILFNQVLDAIEEDYENAEKTSRQEGARLLATLGEASRLAGLYNRAEEAFIKFQRVYPESSYGHHALGSLYLEQGRYYDAQLVLERSVRLVDDVNIQLILGQVYSDQKEWLLAEQMLTMAYERSMLSQRYYLLEARFYKEKGYLMEAAEAFRKATFIRDSIPQRLELAAIYRQLGLDDRADEQCNQAVEVLWKNWPRPLDPTLMAASHCFARMEEQDFYDLINKLVPKQPLIYYVFLGHIYRFKGDLDKARLAYQTIVDAFPSDASPHYFLGETYQAMGMSDLAEQSYRRAAELNPLESLPILALGRMQWSLGERQAALQSFHSAVEMTPGWPEAHLALGNALLAMGDRQMAENHMQLAYWLERRLTDRDIYHFPSHLSAAEIVAPSSEYVRGDFFTVNGDRRYTLFMHPASSASYEVTISEALHPWLVFDIALAPDSWEQAGDGVAFSIEIETGGLTQPLFSAYIDPKNDPSDRRWHPQRVDLGPYAGQTIRLVFSTDPGPSGDDRYDWAGWGDLRLVDWSSPVSQPEK